MDQKGKRPIDIDIEFAACVRKVGGEVLADRFGPSPAFENADYAFLEDGVVAELKRLERDTRSEPTFLARVSQLHQQWVREGKVSPPALPGRQRVSTKDIPRECAQEIENILVSRVRRVVEKANKQIKRTKEVLRTPNAKGLLLLANDGDIIFELDGVLHSLDRVLRGKYRHINSVIYFTANQSVQGPGIPQPAKIWIAPLINDRPAIDRSPVEDAFLEKIKTGWFNHCATITGFPVLAFERRDDSPETIEKFRFVQEQ